MSFASPPSDERRRQLADPRELRALAHPLRLALLDHLMSFGEQTAARCAEAVGSTTSNCSYHLRALGRAGFVERADSADGRERPWRATATGLAYGQDDLELPPAAAEAALRLDELSLARAEQLTRQARRRNDQQPADWRAAEAYHDYGLYITAAELADLTAQIDHLVRPYIAMARRNAPEDAEVAILRLLAFRHPQTP
ncbi:MAG: ArsR/SmtB family transcription factor [Gaiellales bacterium]